jgi:hypothetical protein
MDKNHAWLDAPNFRDSEEIFEARDIRSPQG